MVDLNHLAMVEEVTGLCYPIQERNNVVLGAGDYKSLNSFARSSLALKVMTGYTYDRVFFKKRKEEICKISRCLALLC